MPTSGFWDTGCRTNSFEPRYLGNPASIAEIFSPSATAERLELAALTSRCSLAYFSPGTLEWRFWQSFDPRGCRGAACARRGRRVLNRPGDAGGFGLGATTPITLSDHRVYLLVTCMIFLLQPGDKLWNSKIWHASLQLYVLEVGQTDSRLIREWYETTAVSECFR